MSSQRSKLIITFYIVLISLVVMVTAAYAWMEISSTPTVSDLAISVVTENSLVLAPDVEGRPGEWTALMDMSDLSELTASLQPITYVAAEDAFFLPEYGWDGRISFKNPTRLTDETGNVYPRFRVFEGTGYICSMDFWITTGTSECDVVLSEGAERQDGVLGSGCFAVGEPVWDPGKILHKEGGHGTQDAIRIGFRVHSDDSEGNYIEDERFIIYEPNADGGKGLATTYGVDGQPLQGVNGTLIQQSKSTWTECSPVLQDSVIYSVGSFYDQIPLLRLDRDVARKITMYVWLEGQDQDCTNSIASEGGRILMNIQFSGSALEDHPLESR